MVKVGLFLIEEIRIESRFKLQKIFRYLRLDFKIIKIKNINCRYFYIYYV
jgi:hypothetical protein